MKRLLMAVLFVTTSIGIAAAQSRPATATKPDGEMRWALYVTLAPAWFDPGEVTAGFLTPFWILYAMHDALVKPMPGAWLRTRPGAEHGDGWGRPIRWPRRDDAEPR